MSESAKVVPLARGRRRRGEASAEARAVPEETADTTAARDGFLVALARVLEAGADGLSLENVARLWSALYFAWHSEEVDEFGYDPKFLETILPFLEFLYAMWWRVEVSGIENVPEAGPALVVANHSGVLPWDGLMVNLAIRHEHEHGRGVAP